MLVLRALGAELGDCDGRGDPLRGLTATRLNVAIRERKRELWSRVLEPVIVAWEGRLPPVTVRLSATGPGRVRSSCQRGEPMVVVALEGGVEDYRTVTRSPPQVLATETIGRSRFELCLLPGVAETITPLPPGRHRLRIEFRGSVGEGTLISAPRRCWPSRFRNDPEATDACSLKHEEAGRATQADTGSPPGELADLMGGRVGRAWGVFAPLYALRSERDWGVGDLADLETLLEWVAGQRGDLVATLPLLAGYLDRPSEPAPYRPISRLFWNELYLAVDQIPEWERCAPARDLWNSEEVQARVRRLRMEPTVDYQEVMALKRSVLERLARCFFESGEPSRAEAFAAYKRSQPHVEDYADFRARSETVGTDWRKWPTSSRSKRTKTLFEGDSATHYHLYCQWQMDQQLTHLSEGRDHRVRTAPIPDDGSRETPGLGLAPCRSSRGLLLDLPLGVHPGGYDTWKWPGLFSMDMSCGAPPDEFFARGQDWSVPPLHPRQIREQGHSYFSECLRNHMRHARCLRMDHVMALHRLYWVPEGMEPAEGVYVEYPRDELYAILCLESQRHRVAVAGEDLGTVPAGVRSAMRRHGLLRTWVLQASLRPRAASPLGRVPARAVALTSTHDMFPLAGFARGDDITSRVKLGQLEYERACRELVTRDHAVARLRAFLSASDSGETGLLRAVLAWLACGPSEMVVINLEDLLLETRPQNVPGTGWESGNWQRKLAVNLECLFAAGGIVGRKERISR